MDECNDKIRGVLKGRLPSDKDLKKEIINAFGYVLDIFSAFAGTACKICCIYNIIMLCFLLQF